MRDQNKDIARRFVAVFATGDLTTFDDIVADDVVDHDARPDAKPGRAGLDAAVAMYRDAFPDLEITVDHTIAEGDLVAVYGHGTGTNTGALMGTPPTDRQATFAYTDIYRITDGRVVETWHVEDVAGILAQLGLLEA